jgi:hypothetical protein
MAASPPSRFPPNRPAVSTAERVRRSEYVRDTKGALARGETFEVRSMHHEEFADRWAAWLRMRMHQTGCDDPSRVLPDAFARVEQLIDDRVAAALKEFKTNLKEVLK